MFAVTAALFLAQLLAAKFVPPLNEVAYAAYARQRDVGAAPLLATIRLVLLVALPAYAGLAVVAPVLVPVLLGEKWIGIVPLLPVLAISLLATSLPALMQSALPLDLVRGGLERAAMPESLGALLIGLQLGLLALGPGDQAEQAREICQAPA